MTINERDARLLCRIADTTAEQWMPTTTKGKNARRMLILLARKLRRRMTDARINENAPKTPHKRV